MIWYRIALQKTFSIKLQLNSCQRNGIPYVEVLGHKRNKRPSWFSHSFGIFRSFGTLFVELFTKLFGRQCWMKFMVLLLILSTNQIQWSNRWIYIRCIHLVITQVHKLFCRVFNHPDELWQPDNLSEKNTTNSRNNHFIWRWQCQTALTQHVLLSI